MTDKERKRIATLNQYLSYAQSEGNRTIKGIEIEKQIKYLQHTIAKLSTGRKSNVNNSR